ncbi:hypothetical protein BD626DRAFT_491914 [Schizophyllum amplum]|uniref:Uncharacterized protein n=1 Tax=Schizophyllum amplum TaxID=97359 RepID=A0A550CI43_9AGAR|nr:hypothetical protein BD626DRAFT_491914 [Auriculariopsis ampla]
MNWSNAVGLLAECRCVVGRMPLRYWQNAVALLAARGGIHTEVGPARRWRSATHLHTSRRSTEDKEDGRRSDDSDEQQLSPLARPHDGTGGFLLFMHGLTYLALTQIRTAPLCRSRRAGSYRQSRSALRVVQAEKGQPRSHVAVTQVRVRLRPSLITVSTAASRRTLRRGRSRVASLEVDSGPFDMDPLSMDGGSSLAVKVDNRFKGATKTDALMTEG